MRNPLRKELLACFEREFKPRFPQFAPVDQDRHKWTWTWNFAPNLTFFVMLQAFESEDQFVVEVSWSEDGEFPWGSIGQVKIDRPQGRERLGQFWRQGKAEPIWDISPEMTAARQEALEALRRGESPEYPPDPPVEQILPRVCPLVRDAVAKFEQYGIPLFRRVVETRGLAWPTEVGPGREEQLR